MILVIDNYDSFTYNLVQYLGEMGHELRVFRNDRVTLQEIGALKPSHIVISPGPVRPKTREYRRRSSNFSTRRSRFSEFVLGIRLSAKSLAGRSSGLRR
jgi:anthranilate/para-aminobenzoate synthase component II